MKYQNVNAPQAGTITIHETSSLFRYDFVLFDYSAEEYLALGRDEETTLVCKHKK